MSEAKSDHDLLTRIDERTQKIDKCLSNHLSEHRRYTYGLVFALVTMAISVFVLAVTR